MKVLICVLLSTGSCSVAASLEEFYSHIDGIRSMRADFIQKTFDEDLGLLEISSGTMALGRPSKFRWVYAPPYPQSIVSDGKKVWIYDPDLKQVSISDFDHSQDGLMVVFSGDKLQRASYAVKRIFRDGDDNAWFEVVPKISSGFFKTMYFGFSGDTLSTVEFKTSVDRLLKILFNKVERNVLLDDNFFQFVIPEDVDVVRNFLK